MAAYMVISLEDSPRARMLRDVHATDK